MREDGRRRSGLVLAYGDPDYSEDVGSGTMGPALRHCGAGEKCLVCVTPAGTTEMGTITAEGFAKFIDNLVDNVKGEMRCGSHMVLVPGDVEDGVRGGTSEENIQKWMFDMAHGKLLPLKVPWPLHPDGSHNVIANA